MRFAAGRHDERVVLEVAEMRTRTLPALRAVGGNGWRAEAPTVA